KKSVIFKCPCNLSCHSAYGFKVNFLKEGASMQHYIVEKGDTLWLIAKRFGVSLEELIRANPQIKDPNKIYPGNRINIPLPSEGGMSVYTVRPGDTMWLIAKKFGISLERLLKANPQIKDPDRIDVGQRIFIPQGHGGGGGGT